jgi:type I site-specific restriction endonuclease
MSRETQKICPRCGEPYRWIYRENIHGRSYLYAVHEYVDENGRKRRRKCYLGPEGNYEYVSATHDLEFYGLTKEDRYIRYLEEIIDLFDVDEPISTDPEEFKRDFENVMRTRSLVKRISYEIDERLRKILETIISDIKASIDLLKRDYPDNSQAQDLIKELETFNRKIDRMILGKNFVNEETIRSYVERYLQLKQRLKQFNL